MVMARLEMRQDDIAEAGEDTRAPSISAASSCSLSSALERGQQDQRREGQPLPRHDQDDREQRAHLLSQTTGSAPKALPQMGEQTVRRIHEHVLPDQRGYGRHHEERRDDEDAHNALPPHRLIQQHGQQDAEHDRDQKDAADDDQAWSARRARTRWTMMKRDVVLEARRSLEVPAAKGQEAACIENHRVSSTSGHKHPDREAG